MTTLLLATIVLIGMAARFIGVTWGQPFVYHADEGVVVKAGLQMAGTGDWDPHTFLYPSFLIDIEAVVATIGHAVWGWPLAIDQAWLFPTEVLPEQFGAFLVGRVLVASLGVATILVTFVIARQLGGRLAGLVAAAVVAIAPSHIESSRFVTTDVPVTLMCTIVLLASIRAVRQPDRTRWWIVAAACVGLATSTKWNGLAVGIVPATLYLTSRARPVRVMAVLKSRTPWLMLAAAVLALVAATPGVVLAPAEVAGWLGTQAATYSSAIYADLRGPDEANGVIVEFRSIVEGFGPGIVGAGLLGLIGLIAVRRRIEFAIALFIVMYVLILSIPVLHYPRNALPVLPFVAIAIGLLPASVASAARRVRLTASDIPRKIGSGHWIRPLVAGLIVLAMMPALTQDIADARVLRHADTRSVAYSWILTNLPHNAIVAREQYTPQLTPDQFRLRNHDGLYQRGMAWYRDQNVDYLIASSAIYLRYVDNPARPFDDAFYRALFALPEVFHIDPGATRPGPTIRIFRLTPAAATRSKAPSAFEPDD